MRAAGDASKFFYRVLGQLALIGEQLMENGIGQRPLEFAGR